MQNKEFRILQVVGGLSRGGTETMVMNLYRQCLNLNVHFDFLVYYDSDGSFDKEIEETGGRVIRIPRRNKRNVFKYLAEFRNVNMVYGPYDVVHAHTQFHSGIVLLCARLVGINRRICHAHSTADSSHTTWLRKIYQLMMRFLILVNSTELLACGMDAGKFVYGNSFLSKGTVLPNAIDPLKFFQVSEAEKTACIQDIGVERGKIVIGSVASFREAKNHSFMIRIAQELSRRRVPFKMVFAGGGSLFEKTRQEVNSLGLSRDIVFLGVRDDVAALMKTFDVLLMPSLYEGLPVTLVESQASSVAAVVSDNITNEVDFNLGLIIKASLSDDIDTWISAIKKGALLKNSVSRDDIIEQLTNRGYLVQESIKQLMKLYGVFDKDVREVNVRVSSTV